ncbi:MAG: hypothetical protein ACP5G1_04270 [Nanopusillaceae archaeon]
MIDINRKKWKKVVLENASERDLERLLESYNLDNLIKNTPDNFY